MTTTVIISLDDDAITLTCDLANAAAPLLVDGQEIGYQTHDAQHDIQRAVLLAARRTWPDAQWPRPEDDLKDGANEAWDALEYATIDFGAVKAHGRRAGREDYLERAKDVALGHEDPEWAWPLSGADEAYLSAVGPGKICRDLGLPRAAWEAISETWFDAFREGYEAAHLPDEITDEQIAQLRAEAAQAGDLVMTAICDVALASQLDEIAEIDGSVRSELERRGIIPERVGADVLARAECERVIRALADKDEQ